MAAERTNEATPIVQQGRKKKGSGKYLPRRERESSWVRSILLHSFGCGREREREREREEKRGIKRLFFNGPNEVKEWEKKGGGRKGGERFPNTMTTIANDEGVFFSCMRASLRGGAQWSQGRTGRRDSCVGDVCSERLKSLKVIRVLSSFVYLFLHDSYMLRNNFVEKKPRKIPAEVFRKSPPTRKYPLILNK